MVQTMNNERNKSLVFTFFWIVLILNMIVLVFQGLFSILDIILMRELTAILVICTIVLNLCLISVNFKILDLNEKGDRMIKNLVWIYLIFFFFAIILIMLGPIMQALRTNPRLIILILSRIGIYGIFIFGAMISLFDIQLLQK